MASTSPAVSIVVPMYNLSLYVRDAVQSVLDQTYSDYEIILIDDCSTDDTVAIAKSIEDPRIILLENSQNSGAGESRNAGVRAARGRYIAFLDGDDLWYPGKLQGQMAFMEETGAAVVYTRYDVVDQNGKVYADSGRLPAKATYHRLLRHCFIRTSSLIFDVEKLGRKVYFPKIRKRQDFIFFLELIKLAGKADLLDLNTCSYRLHPGGISARKFDNIPYQWAAYRKEEKLSVAYSTFLMANWFARAGKVVLQRKLKERRAGSAESHTA